MSKQTGAYRSNKPEVLEAWNAYQDHVQEIGRAREKLVGRFGRHLWINSSGFSHGTRVVGFEELEGDTEETLPPELRKNKTTGRIEPNRRRKAGKDLDAELDKLSTHGPDLPGMPGFTMVGLTVLRPGLRLIDGWVVAFWGDGQESGNHEVDDAIWERMPMSQYYAMIEALEKESEDEAS